MSHTDAAQKPSLLVLASTYPRYVDDPEPGFVHELCKRLAIRFDVTALVPDAPGADPNGTMDGVQVVRYHYAPRRLQTLVNNGGIAGNLRRSRWKWLLVPGFILGQYLAARRLLKMQKIDAIHAHWLLPQGLIAARLRRLVQCPFVVTSHGGDLFGLRGAVLTAAKRRVAKASSAMTVVSSAMRDEARRIGLQPPSLDVVPMGVDLRHRFVVDPEQKRASDELLFVGRLVAKKGLCHLLNALPAVLARRPQVTLRIVGFGPEEKALAQQAAELGIADRIIFAGPTPQHALPALYRSASLFVAPFIRDDSGNQEGLPVVLMEAIGCGCPAVVGNVAGIHDLVGSLADKICVEPTDHDALANAIVTTLDDPQAAQRRALDVRSAVVSRIDWETIASRYADIIASTLRVRD